MGHDVKLISQCIGCLREGVRRKNINFKTKKTALFWFSMCSCVNANQVLSDCVVGVFLPLQRK